MAGDGSPPPSKKVSFTAVPSWHSLSVTDICDLLKTSPAGLAFDEAARRCLEFGPNELRPARSISPWAILLQQFRNVLIVILMVAAVLSAGLGHGVEAATIAVILTVTVLLGFFQEYRAELALDALRRMAAPSATAVRGGVETVVPARELVPGDVILLRAGDRIPADVRLMSAVNLQVEEAALTGESVPVEKAASVLERGEQSLGDRKNMAYAGTIATYGRGSGVVVATGMATEFGRIAGMLEAVAPGRTPLQENLDRVGGLLARSAFVIVALIVSLGLLRGQPLFEMLMFGIALAVAVVPEALPAVVTISLALGVQRMAGRHALMRRLPAVETLGSTSVICTDKTGTLTKDEMTVRTIWCAGKAVYVFGTGYEPYGSFSCDGVPYGPTDAVNRLLRAAVLASDAHLVHDGAGDRWEIAGDPTEGALVVAAAKAGIQREGIDREYPRVDEIPFTSETRRMTTLLRGPDGAVACAKGAPEVILESCERVLSATGEVPLDMAGREMILNTARSMAGAALRVLAVSDRPAASRETAEQGMTFLGLVGMIDPPRPEAIQAVATCHQAGIRTVMITGDHPLTARAVADELGISGSGRVITGADLEEMSDEELAGVVAETGIYARVSPAHKLRVVTALQAAGHIVAMTGDGVNDAPALKKADIGIAMGLTGTEVSREAAAMVLTDDNFASIVAAVEEGRGIYSNIRKYLMYLLSSNIGEIGLMAVATLAGMPLPLSAVQILYVNLATDGLPALALAVDPSEPDLMRRRPREQGAGMFTLPVTVLMLAGGAWSTLVNSALFVWALHSGRPVEEAMTMTFVSLALIQFIKAYNFRSDRLSVFTNPFANRWLNLAVTWELLLLVLIVHLPLFHRPFGTYSMSSADWVVVLLVSSTVSPVLELVKWLARRDLLGSALR